MTARDDYPSLAVLAAWDGYVQQRDAERALNEIDLLRKVTDARGCPENVGYCPCILLMGHEDGHACEHGGLVP